MATCEDYPCCGHTDGLGCDWVSPNEIVPCDVCIEARRINPYHNRANGCPTVEERNTRFTDGEDCADCEDEESSVYIGDEPLCLGCIAERKAYDREMQEQHDYPY